MSVASHIARGRGRHALLMLDACTVTRAAGPKVYNPVTKTYTTPTTTVYTGQCRVVPWRGNDEQAAGTEVAVYRYRIQFPLTATTPEIKRYDVVTITTSSNPTMVGKALDVTEPELGTTATALMVTAELAS